MSVGIDDLSLYASALALDFRALLGVRRNVEESDWQNIGFHRRTVLPPWEDAVTLAVNAARPLDTSKVGLLVVGTESAVDFGKPISSWVHGALNLPADCRNFEVKHACYGGTAALHTALDWLRARRGSGRTALVITTDEARRHPDDPSELNGGCGAVALLLREDPRLVAFDPEGFPAAMDVWDVARPSATFEWGDPVLSLYAYLDLAEAAFDRWREATGKSTDDLDFLLYHAPLLSLLQQVHQVVLASEGVFGNEVAARFERMVAPSLGYNRELGNIYGGSLYASLAGLLAHNDVPGGARLGMFAYGSGACAELWTGVVQPGASQRVRARGIDAHLKARRPVDVATFDALGIATEGRFGREVEGPHVPPAPEWAPLFEEAYAGTGRLVLTHIDRYRRHYVGA